MNPSDKPGTWLGFPRRTTRERLQGAHLITEDEKKWLRVRWEFLRQDPKYLRLWGQLQDFYAGKIKIDEGSTVESHSAALALAQEISVGFQQVGLDQWIDPNLDFEDILQEEHLDYWGNKLTIHHLLSRQTHAVLVDLPNPNSERFPTTMTLHIDLARVNSRTLLKKYINDLIDQQFNNTEIDLKRNRRMVDYEVILKVGTLRNQGLTFKDIARRLFPRDFNEDSKEPNPESAESKVKQYYARFEELVKGGHIDLTFP